MGEETSLTVQYQAGGQESTITWTPGSRPPRVANHGALGVCFAGGDVLLVTQDGSSWELPAGRAEPGETPKQTLIREIQEEGCCTIQRAQYLGTTVSRCIRGPEAGIELTRTHWCALVAVDAWDPQYETVARRFAPPSEVLEALQPEGGMREILQAILASARELRPV